MISKAFSEGNPRAESTTAQCGALWIRAVSQITYRSKTVEVKGSHAVYVSQPEAVADLIARAAQDGQHM
jgi:hypothetical protein